MKETVLVTGCAGFIGYHVCDKLLKEDYRVIGIDNLSDYYDVNIKYDRVNDLQRRYKDKFSMVGMDICSYLVEGVFDLYKPEKVIHLAAQASVRYSLVNPDVYIQSNIDGFYKIINRCALHNVKQFIYASSSSVYGENAYESFKENIRTDSQESLYGATKKCNEILAEYYSNMYDMPCIGLRFFTVYGEFGRPDMFYYDIVNKWTKGEKIKLYNSGDNFRNFTYIDDAVERIYSALTDDELISHNIFNVASDESSISMNDFTKMIYDICLENDLIKGNAAYEDLVEYAGWSKGDVCYTRSDNTKCIAGLGEHKSTPLKEGLVKFIKWYKEYEL